LIVTHNGIIFCQEVKTRHIGHLKPLITLGNQKWHGAAPILNINAIQAKIRKKEVSFKRRGWYEKDDIILRSRIAEPDAWTRKYFIALSASWLILIIIIKGIIARRLSSILIHVRSQWFLDRAVIVAATKIEENNVENG